MTLFDDATAGADGARILTRPQKAAVIIGVLGADDAGPILEQFDEGALRSFTRAMASLKRIDPVDVRATIAEFLTELHAEAAGLSGGVGRARSLLEDHVAEGVLARVLEDAGPVEPSAVWQRLGKIDAGRLAGFLAQEHPRTAAVILARFAPEEAARIVNALPAEAADAIVAGLARAGETDTSVVDAIADAMGRDVLANLRPSPGATADPAAQAGTIMNYTSATVRDRILEGLGATTPELAARIRRTMFTIADVPRRLPKTAVAAVVRTMDQDSFLKLLSGLTGEMQEIADFLLENISSRMAGQMREDLAELGPVTQANAEEAQTTLIKTIRTLAGQGEFQLIEPEDNAEDGVKG